MQNRRQVAANIAILIGLAVYLASWGHARYERYRHPAHGTQASAPLVGSTVKLPEVNFAPPASAPGRSAPKTLILAISTVCHFCKDSEPFYQQLAAHNQGKVKLVAVLPQSLAEGQAYVQKSIAPSGEPIQVVSSELDAIGVHGTPTLLLVDGTGKVQQAWVGKLSDQGQKEVQALVE